MKIRHEPYGVDDPYKETALERYPRDPRPGDLVQVRFATDPRASSAWADVSTAAGHRRVTAEPLGEGTWTVDLGSFGPGSVQYTLGADHIGKSEAQAEESASEPVAHDDIDARFLFEVGTRRCVSGVKGAAVRGDRVRLDLETRAAAGSATDVERYDPERNDPEQYDPDRNDSAVSAYLDLSFPLAGVVHLELVTGGSPGAATDVQSSGRDEAAAPSIPFRLERHADSLAIEAPGIEVSIDLTDLRLTAHCPGRQDPAFSGSLRFDWLAQADGQISEVRACFTTRREEWLYGLGERFTGANRNGESWDVRVYEEYKEQGKRTYLPVPFVVSNRGYGLWLDAAEPSYFDLRTTEARMSVDKFVERRPGSGSVIDRRPSVPATDARVADAPATDTPATDAPLLSAYVLVGEEPYDITAAFTRLSGEIAVPPKWAFTPWMSSNSWNSQARAEAVVERTVSEDVPAGVIVIEAWSDESTFYIFNDAKYEALPGAEAPKLADFTFAGRWPDPKAFIDDCHRRGIRVVLWQIPVLKHLTEPHRQHDNDERFMLEQGLGIANADGSAYRNKGWWFTDGLVLDFTNPKAREWWFAKRRYLFDDLGIDGLKTDGGEHLWGRDLRAHDGRRGLELVNAYANEYVGAYHEFVQAATGNDGVTFSRAGFTGAQRFPGHWAGDEDSSWDAYRASIRAGLSAGVSGVSMWSWDIGGFSGDVPPVELYLRSTAMAVFSPLMQYHSEGHGATEVRDRTPWNIAERNADPSAIELYRRFAKLRLRLLDLIYEDAVALSAAGLPLMRYPALAYPEEHDFLAADPYLYLFGRDLLVAPVVDKGVGARAVRLPPGDWVDAWSGSRFMGPRFLQATASIERIPVFVRADSPRLRRWLDAFKEPEGGRT